MTEGTLALILLELRGIRRELEALAETVRAAVKP